MHLSHVDLLLWAATSAGHVALLAVLAIRRRVKAFPVFTSLITVNVFKSSVLFLVYLHGSRSAYFYTYVGFLILDLTLQLAVVFEMAARVFRPAGAWSREVAHNLTSLAIVSVSLATGLSLLAQPHTHVVAKAAIIRFDLFSAVLVSTLFVGFVALSVRAGLPWRTHVARISQGLAVYSVFDVIIESARTCFGVSTATDFYRVLSEVRIIVYCVCLLYWIITLWQEAPAPKVLDSQMRWQLTALQSKVEQDLASLRLRRK
jgi:hypothetical protein